jgi:hypothetical protein
MKPSLETTIKTLREVVKNNTDLLAKVHIDDDSLLSDELHYALYSLNLAYYHLDAAIAEMDDASEDSTNG